MINQSLLQCKKKLEFLEKDEGSKLEESKEKENKLRFNEKIFREIVQEISDENCGEKLEWAAVSAKVLQRAAEDFLVEVFEDANLIAEHGRRITLMVKDVQLARRMRGRYECYIESAKIN